MSEDLFLHLEVRLDIPVRGTELAMAKPERDDLNGDAGLEQVHCTSVAPRVKGDSALA